MIERSALGAAAARGPGVAGASASSRWRRRVLAAVRLPAAARTRALAAGAHRIAELAGPHPRSRAAARAGARTAGLARTPSGRCLPGSTPAVAAAQLQGDLAGLGGGHGRRDHHRRRSWSRRRPRRSPGSACGSACSGDTATVRDFLYAVETREPMLIVRRMELGAQRPRGNESAGKSHTCRHLRGLRLRPGRDPALELPPGRLRSCSRLPGQGTMLTARNGGDCV